MGSPTSSTTGNTATSSPTATLGRTRASCNVRLTSTAGQPRRWPVMTPGRQPDEQRRHRRCSPTRPGHLRPARGGHRWIPPTPPCSISTTNRCRRSPPQSVASHWPWLANNGYNADPSDCHCRPRSSLGRCTSASLRSGAGDPTGCRRAPGADTAAHLNEKSPPIIDISRPHRPTRTSPLGAAHSGARPCAVRRRAIRGTAALT